MKKDYYYDPLMQPAIKYERRRAMKEKIFEFLGRLKVYGDVARYYLNLIQFALILWGFVEVMKYGALTIFLIIASCVVGTSILVIFHVRYIMKYEFNYLSRRDPIKMKTLENTEK